jgi:hypothetical protein
VASQKEIHKNPHEQSAHHKKKLLKLNIKFNTLTTCIHTELGFLSSTKNLKDHNNY